MKDEIKTEENASEIKSSYMDSSQKIIIDLTQAMIKSEQRSWDAVLAALTGIYSNPSNTEKTHEDLVKDAVQAGLEASYQYIQSLTDDVRLSCGIEGVKEAVKKSHNNSPML